MSDPNRLLQAAFLFSAEEVLANRQGKFSERQQARQRAAGTNLWLAAGVFVLVMLGSLGVILIMNLPSGATTNLQEENTALVVVAAVIVLVIMVGLGLSLRYMPIARVKRVSVAEGKARWGRADADRANFELRIGTTKLRLLTVEQLGAFIEGEEYRVYFLKGPVPTILSAEALNFPVEMAEMPAPRSYQPVDNDPVVKMQRKARLILFILPVLVLGIPLVGFASAGMPAVARLGVMAILLFIAIGFVYWALRRVGASENG